MFLEEVPSGAQNICKIAMVFRPLAYGMESALNNLRSEQFERSQSAQSALRALTFTSKFQKENSKIGVTQRRSSDRRASDMYEKEKEKLLL